MNSMLFDEAKFQQVMGSDIEEVARPYSEEELRKLKEAEAEDQMIDTAHQQIKPILDHPEQGV